MANISITNPTILNSETADVTKLTQNDNDILNGLTDGSKDINVNAITAAGLITGNGGIATGASGDDVYSVVWTDYASSSTIVGWSGTPTAYIRYKKIGKMVFVQFDISGTSNSTSVTFTVPYAAANTTITQNGITTVVIDDGTAAAMGRCYIGAAGSTVTCKKSVDGAWTNSGSKNAAGFIFYEASS